MMRKTRSFSAAILKIAIIADAQTGNSLKEKKFNILVTFDCIWLPDVVVLPFVSAALFVVAPLKYEETIADCNDSFIVLGAFEVLTVGVFDLSVSVFRVSAMSKQIPYL